MKALSLLLIPAIALLVSACASGPAVGPVYGYGPGPDPRDGYYWNGTVYIQGESPYRHNDQYSRNVTDVNDVNVTRTNVNDTTVNDTNVNDRTVDRTNVNQANDKSRQLNARKPKTAHKPVQKDQKDQKNQQGNQ